MYFNKEFLFGMLASYNGPPHQDILSSHTHPTPPPRPDDKEEIDPSKKKNKQKVEKEVERNDSDGTSSLPGGSSHPYSSKK